MRACVCACASVYVCVCMHICSSTVSIYFVFFKLACECVIMRQIVHPRCMTVALVQYRNRGGMRKFV